MVTITTTRGDRFLRSFIDTDKGTVSRELYVNEDVFQQELEQIFGRCWLFIGHESLVPNPGDFVITRMGTEEILLVRDRKDKQIRAFLNSCRHRGEKVCRYDQGNALVFTCPFHAWTYDSAGRLVGAAGINNPASYAGALDRDEWGLVEVGQFKNYHGTLWATWDKKAPSFEDYLGPFAESVRYMAEATDGTDGAEVLEVFTPFQKWRLPTNWKIPAFTSATRPGARGDDAPLRQRGRHRPDARRRVTAAAATAGSAAASRRSPTCVGDHNLGHGGNWTELPGARHRALPWTPGTSRASTTTSARTHEKKQEKYKDTIMPPHGHGAGHFCVFPNFIMDGWRWRYWHPHEVGVVERWSLFSVDKEAPQVRQGRHPSLRDALQRPFRLHRVGRHGELELRLPGQPGRHGAQVRLQLRERPRPRRRARTACPAASSSTTAAPRSRTARASAAGSPSWKRRAGTTSTRSTRTRTTASGRRGGSVESDKTKYDLGGVHGAEVFRDLPEGVKVTMQQRDGRSRSSATRPMALSADPDNGEPEDPSQGR